MKIEILIKGELIKKFGYMDMELEIGVKKDNIELESISPSQFVEIKSVILQSLATISKQVK